MNEISNKCTVPSSNLISFDVDINPSTVFDLLNYMSVISFAILPRYNVHFNLPLVASKILILIPPFSAIANKVPS